MDACIWSVLSVSINGAGSVELQWIASFTKDREAALFVKLLGKQVLRVIDRPVAEL